MRAFGYVSVNDDSFGGLWSARKSGWRSLAVDFPLVQGVAGHRAGGRCAVGSGRLGGVVGGVGGGDISYPMLMVGGMVALLVFPVGVTLVAILWRGCHWRWLVALLGVLLVVDFGWLPVGKYWAWHGRPYTRAEVALIARDAPRVDLSGTWKGTWTNPKMSRRETVMLSLEQVGAEVAGTFTTDSGREFRVLEGVVSGDEVDLFYGVGGTEWGHRGGVGTLRGRVDGVTMECTWYAHSRPPRGASRQGPAAFGRVSEAEVD